MALEEIFSNYNTVKMRNQLSELNVGPYGYGMHNQIVPQLSTTRDEYKNAHLLSYAEKLDLLLEAQESGNGRYVMQSHKFSTE
jgi:hypothetical protein